MIEHRLIERLIAVLNEALEKLLSGGPVNARLLFDAVDFFRTYADRTHHGKEEDILFRDLKQKRLEVEHTRIMTELEEEHVAGRRLVGDLLEAARTYRDRGDQTELPRLLRELVEFYPRHIMKEDRGFFRPVMDYFSNDELRSMSAEMRDFDARMIHEHYERLVTDYEAE